MKPKALFVLFTVIIIQTVFAQLPETYDLRDLDLVTSVKAQKDGTCWCHGTYSGIESDLLLTKNWENAGESGDPNMAEYHLDWWHGFNVAWNGDFEDENQTGIGTHKGGDYKIFCSYMSRLEGPIREVDAPGDEENSIPSMNSVDLWDPDYHRWYVPDINWYYIDNPDKPAGNIEWIDSIKIALMESGVMPTNYLCSGVQTGTYDGKKTYYQNITASGDANHSVAIIGWDDNANTPASEDGAWLCKNSWGPGNTDFLWISYFDKHCCRNVEMSVVSFHDVQPLPYTNVYYHDYHGWRDTMTSAKEAFNKFVGDNTKPECLIAVSFITAVDHEEWEVKVYDTFEGGELKDEVSSASGTITHMGFHTRPLDNLVVIENDNDFYIYVKFTNGFQAYDRTSSPPAIAMVKPRASPIIPSKSEKDQSYYRTSPTSEWLDLYDYEETIIVDGDEIDCQGTQNFCIKGLVSDTFTTDIAVKPEHQKKGYKLFNTPNPFTNHTTINYSLTENSAVSLAIYNARGRQIRSLVSERGSAGPHQVSWNGRNNVNMLVSNGVYYAVLTVKTTHGTVTEKRKMFLLK